MVTLKLPPGPRLRPAGIALHCLPRSPSLPVSAARCPPIGHQAPAHLFNLALPSASPITASQPLLPVVHTCWPAGSGPLATRADKVTAMATDAATPALHRIERAAIAAASHVEYSPQV